MLRYGRSAAYYDAMAQERISDQQAEQRLGRIPREHWRQARAEARQQHRFKHHRDHYLKCLEARWVQALSDT